MWKLKFCLTYHPSRRRAVCPPLLFLSDSRPWGGLRVLGHQKFPSGRRDFSDFEKMIIFENVKIEVFSDRRPWGGLRGLGLRHFTQYGHQKLCFSQILKFSKFEIFENSKKRNFQNFKKLTSKMHKKFSDNGREYLKRGCWVCRPFF